VLHYLSFHDRVLTIQLLSVVMKHSLRPIKITKFRMHNMHVFVCCCLNLKQILSELVAVVKTAGTFFETDIPCMNCETFGVLTLSGRVHF
jgi:hypothetical protein